MSAIHWKPVCAILAFGVFCHTHAQTAGASMNFVIAEISGGAVVGGDVRVSVDGGQATVTRNGGAVSFKTQSQFREIRIDIQPGGAYWNRTVPVLASGWKQNASKSFYVTRKMNTYTRDYVLRGVSLLNARQIDQGLAHFEPAYHGDPLRQASPTLDGYEAMLRFNYARALQQACLLEEYNTCTEAVAGLESVLREIDATVSNANIYKNNGVTRELAAKALADIHDKQAIGMYQSVLVEANRENYALALKGLAEIESDMVNRPALYSRVGMNKSRIAGDRALFETRAQMRTGR